MEKPAKIKPESLERAVHRLNFTRAIEKTEKKVDFIDFIECSTCGGEYTPIYVKNKKMFKRPCLFCGSL